MFACPHCHQPGVDLWQRLCLGSGTSTRCQRCHQPISVPNEAWLFALVYGASAGLAGIMDQGLRLLVWIAAVMLHAALHLSAIPLIVITPQRAEELIRARGRLGWLLLIVLLGAVAGVCAGLMISTSAGLENQMGVVVLIAMVLVPLSLLAMPRALAVLIALAIIGAMAALIAAP